MTCVQTQVTLSSCERRWFRLKCFTQGRFAQRLELVAGQQLVAERCIWHTLWWFPVHVRCCTTAYWAITAARFWISTCSIRFSLLLWAVWVALKNDNTFPHKSGSLFEKQKKLRQVFSQINKLRQVFFKISELRQLASTNLLLVGPFSETECLYTRNVVLFPDCGLNSYFVIPSCIWRRRNK